MSPPSGPPVYKGEPLDAERGPGLGCFWIQVALLAFFLVFTPLTVTWGWDPFISGALLIFTLILLLFSGQTVIFLLRLVAADRRTRRTPLDPAARPTVGQMEDRDAAGPAQPTGEVLTSAAHLAGDAPEDGGSAARGGGTSVSASGVAGSESSEVARDGTPGGGGPQDGPEPSPGASGTSEDQDERG